MKIFRKTAIRSISLQNLVYLLYYITKNYTYYYQTNHYYKRNARFKITVWLRKITVCLFAMTSWRRFL